MCVDVHSEGGSKERLLESKRASATASNSKIYIAETLHCSSLNSQVSSKVACAECGLCSRALLFLRRKLKKALYKLKLYIRTKENEPMGQRFEGQGSTPRSRYRRRFLRRVSYTLSSVFYRTLDKEAICRVPEIKHSAKR